MFDVLCAGLMVGDIIAYPVSGNIMETDTCAVEKVGYFTGGDALNAAAALSRLGKKVKLAGAVGDDMMGNMIMENARKEKIDVSGVRVSHAPTATSIVLTGHEGERHFAYLSGANDLFSADMVSDNDIQNSRAVYVGSAMALRSLDGGGLADLFERAKKAGAVTAFDCTFDKDGLWLKKIEKALCFADIFIPSYDEAAAITGETKPSEMARFMAGYGLKIFGVKLGAEGSYLTDFTNEYRIGAFRPEKVVDTTGAGDCYMAGFMAAFPDGCGVMESGVFASATAKFCVEALGAVSNIPSFETVKKFADENICRREKRPFSG